MNDPTRNKKTYDRLQRMIDLSEIIAELHRLEDRVEELEDDLLEARRASPEATP